MGSATVRGTIIKGIGGFYYVKTCDGIVAAKGRGSLKRDGASLLVGDIVTIRFLESKEDNFEAVIESLEVRKNKLVRPPISNVDKLVIVVSATKPKVNFELVDRFLTVAEDKHIPVMLVMNKADTGCENTIAEMENIYKNLYEFLPVSAATGYNMDLLTEKLSGLKVALAGPSGVGKSSIINIISNKNIMETGSISKKNSRGRHTTRHVEIINGDMDIMIYDTPGFTSMDLPNIEASELKQLFPEFRLISENCKFQNCNHLKEPHCAVNLALEEGQINRSRYESYSRFFDELLKRKKY